MRPFATERMATDAETGIAVKVLHSNPLGISSHGYLTHSGAPTQMAFCLTHLLDLYADPEMPNERGWYGTLSLSNQVAMHPFPICPVAKMDFKASRCCCTEDWVGFAHHQLGQFKGSLELGP